jgi:hypothetical protein
VNNAMLGLTSDKSTFYQHHEHWSVVGSCLAG